MKGMYKAVLYSENLYKEVGLSPEMKEVRIGTSQECEVRLRKELFFAPVEILLIQENGVWNIVCGNGLCFTKGNSRRLLRGRLEHGDELQLLYQESGLLLFTFTFAVDFDYEKKDYSLVIDIGGRSMVRIGGQPDCDICVQDEYVGGDTMVLQNRNGSFFLIDNGSRYGVFVNGSRISGSSVIRDFDFFSIAGQSFYYRGGKLYASVSPSVQIKGLSWGRAYNHSTHFEYPNFNRSTRVRYVVPEEEIEIQQASQMPKKPSKNLMMSLIPSLIMLAMTIVLRGLIGGGGTFVIYSAVSMSVGIVMSVITYRSENKEYKEDIRKRDELYHSYIEEKKEKIGKLRAEEARARNLIYESLEESVGEVGAYSRRLFERSQADPDFLQVYLGRGTIESSNPVKYTKQEFINLDDPLAPLPEQVSESFRYLENTPIVSDFRGSGGIGIVGSSQSLLNALKNVTLDLVIRHFYKEVKLVYVLDGYYAERADWIRWLHNVDNEKLNVRNIICDEESRNLILEELYVILSGRENQRRGGGEEETVYEDWYVVIVTNAAAIDSHPVTKYYNSCAQYGFTFVFLENYEENLPQGCGEIIRLQDDGSGSVIKSANGDAVTAFRYPVIPDQTAADIAQKLGSVHVDEVSLEGELTKNITMFELLGILSVEDLDLNARWASSQVHKSLAAPLGVKSKNQMVYLDISDKAGAHGPHGLVAGTTGSGKSEVLQTYILSIATLFHPYEVGFVIIDFKGGGMANQFKDLPHLIGTITNIDGREINRSLASIKAELVKRQEQFARHGVNHINDYIQLYKAGKAVTPLPHLIMIVDEFAELKAEYPDFMKELISAARIGRTLGVHLILATQKPAGVVDAQIWSNSKFKLCLKVQTKEDSNEVIKTPLAAEIVEPGRAYFQVGNNEIFDLFQSAYSGAGVPEGSEAKETIYSIYERNLWGRRTLKYTNKKTGKREKSVSQLQAIVDYVHDYCAGQGIRKLPGICLPSLKLKIRTDELDYSLQSAAGISVPIGFYDDPEQQEQGQVVLEISKDNVYIVGSSQSGKTVMLQTIIYGLIRKYTPQQVNLYLIDCGSMVLKNFEESKHTGGVVLANEEEKCRNLFKMLNTMVVQRKRVLAGKGVGNYAAYLDAGFADMPLAVLVIDNMAAFKEYYPDQTEELASLTREAQGVGISFLITTAASNALNYRVQANFGRKLVLNCNDTGEYGNVFGHCRETPRENPGSGLFLQDKRILEYQTAIFGRSDKEAERSAELKEYIAVRNGELTASAVPIPMVPDRLSMAEMMVQNPDAFRSKGILPIGMSYEQVELVSLNLNTVGSLSLLGDPDSRQTFTCNLLKLIAKTVIFHEIEAVVIDDKSRRLKEFAACGFVRDYTSDVAEGMSLVTDCCSEIMDRREEEDVDGFILLVINNAEVLRRICADRTGSKVLADAVRSADEAASLVMLCNIENQPVGFNASEVMKAVKEERQAILFAPIRENKLYELSGRPRDAASFDNTMGYRIEGGNYSRIKIFGEK